MGIVPTPESDRARFWAKVDKNGPVVRPELGPCWLWTAALFSNGYGAFRLGSKQRRAHVVSYEWHVGPVPQGLSVLHHCDIRRCLRPEHLFAGTQKDNIQDAVSKGRMATGDRSGMYTHPEARAVGERNGQRLHPERTARGDNSGRRLHPESYPKGETHPDAKLTDADALEIRRRRASGESRHALAEQFGVSLSAVDKIHHRRTWKHLP